MKNKVSEVLGGQKVVNEYSTILLRERITNEKKSITAFAERVNMNAQTLNKKINGLSAFNMAEISSIVNELNINSGEECDLYFFLHKENECFVYYSLFKQMLINSVTVSDISSMIYNTEKQVFTKIAGKDTFSDIEMRIIAEICFKNIPINELFKRGCA